MENIIEQEIVFNEQELAQVEKIKSKYPEDQSAIMPLLWMAQKSLAGYLKM